MKVRANSMFINGFKFNWSNRRGLLWNGKEGTPQLSELLNQDCSRLTEDLRSGSRSSDRARREEEKTNEVENFSPLQVKKTSS